MSENTEYFLSFFNNVTDYKEIVEQIKDDPKFRKSSKKAYGIRKSLAQRILNTREKLPKKKFQSLGQLDSIRGIGKDTMHDIIYSLEKKLKSQSDNISSSTVRLNDILIGITSAVVNAKNEMNKTSLDIAKEWADDEMMSLLPLSFFSISEVSLNLRFVIQTNSSKKEDLLVSVNPEYLEKLPDYVVSQINLKMTPQKGISKKLFKNKI